jgi:sugar phosphate isomerase/epimerase
MTHATPPRPQHIRIGTSSYILPDHILPNIRYLAPKVDDVELIFFETPDASNMPTPPELDELRQLAQDHQLTYTIHLPLDAALGHADPAIRCRSIGQCLKVMTLTQPLDPFACVLHLLAPDSAPDAPPAHAPVIAPDAFTRWQEALDRSLTELAQRAPAMPICVETLAYPFEWVAGLVTQHRLNVCLDIGHLLLTGQDVEAAIRRYGAQTRVIHLHGIENGVDHKHIGALDSHLLDLLFTWLASDPAERVLTMEVFSQPDFLKSMETLARYHWHKLKKKAGAV